MKTNILADFQICISVPLITFNWKISGKRTYVPSAAWKKLTKFKEKCGNNLAWGDVATAVKFRDDIWTFLYAVSERDSLANELFLVKLQFYKVK